MQGLLKSGQQLKSISGKRYSVRTFLGSGGQGEVYKVYSESKELALKWYYPHTGTENQKQLIKNLVKIGPPNNKFLWPIEFIEDKTVKGFGYVMGLRPEKYKSIVDLMKRRVEPSFYTLSIASIQLADSFLKLHTKGLCYRDISFGNVFFDPVSGDVLICDNDNVTPEKSRISNVIGTPRFMAPEIVKGKSYPTIKSDLYSLSILLFYMFMIHHPLEGKKESEIKCFDLPAMTKLYGTHPVFIFDPINSTNRPITGLHDNAIAFWNIYPRFIRDIFTKSFTKGIRDLNNGRVTEMEWRVVLTKLKNSILFCSCGVENFYDWDSYKRTSKTGQCWACNKELTLPPRMKIKDDIIMLNPNTRIYKHHITENKVYDFKKIVGMITRNPSDPNVFGLKNMTTDKWEVVLKNGRKQVVEYGRSVKLETGLCINFGETIGNIKA